MTPAERAFHNSHRKLEGALEQARSRREHTRRIIADMRKAMRSRPLTRPEARTETNNDS